MLSAPRLGPALTGALVVMLVGAFALGIYLNGSGIGITPSPSPSPSPTPALPLPESLTDWSRVTLGTQGSHVVRVAAGPRGVVAVVRADDGSRYQVFFSADGREWSAAASPSATGEYVSLVATDRGFLLIFSEEGAWVSQNGLDWQHVADDWGGNPDSGGSIVVDAVAGGPGYVSVGNHNKIWYSADGSNWTAAVVPAPPPLTTPEFPDLTVDIMHVAAVGDALVATGYYATENSDAGGVSQDFVLISSDGRTWSRVLPEIGDRGGPLALGAGPDGFVVIGSPLDGATASTIWHSVDGQEWARAEHEFAAHVDEVAATPSGYVAIGHRGGSDLGPRAAHLWTSADGFVWSALPAGDPFSLGQPGGTGLSSVAALGSEFFVGGQYNGQPAIWISGGH
jgi:hypothetical protein